MRSFVMLVLALGQGCTEPLQVASPPPSTPSTVTVTEPCDEPAPEYAQARELLAHGRLHRTLEVLQIANTRCPSSRHRGWDTEVEALAQIGQHQAASELAEQILRSDDNPAAQKAARSALDIVRVRTPTTTPEQAESASRRQLESAHELLSEAENLAYQAGQATAAGVHYGQAKASYEAAWLARPPNGQALFMAGHCALKQGQPAEAQRLFDRALLELEQTAGEPVELFNRQRQIEKRFSSTKLLAWSPRYQVAVATKSTIELESPSEPGLISLLTGVPVRSLRFTPDGAFIVTGSQDGQLELWSTLDGSLLWSVATNHAPVRALALAPDGQSLFVASADGYLQIRSIVDGDPLPGLGAAAPEPWGSGGGLSEIAVSADGTLLALAGASSIYLWDLTHKRQVGTLTPHARSPHTVAISENGELVASTAGDGKTRIWRWKAGTLLRVLPGNDVFEGSVAFMPGTAQTVITSSTRVRIWEPTTGKLLQVFGEAHGGALAISPDTAGVATMPQPSAVSFWSVESGEPGGQLELPRVGAASEIRLCRVGARAFAYELCAERLK